MGEPGSAIVLIHGIGDQAQGSTLSAFNKFFGKFGPDPKAPDYSQTLRRVRPRSGEEISYFYKLTELDRKPVVIAEMFWSDLSAIRRGFMANLRNAWQIAADAPEIIYASLGPDISDGRVRDYLLLRILRCLVCLAFWTIYFPIVASNLAYGVLFVWIFIFRTVNGLIDDSQIELSSPADATFAGASLLSLALLILLLGTNLTRRIRPLLAWVGAAFAAVAALSCSNIGLPYLSDLLDYQLPTPSSLMGYVGPMTYQNYSSLIRRLNTLWFVPVGVATIYLAALPVLIILLRKRWRGFLLGYAAMFVLIRVWLVLITTCWLVVLNFTLDDARMAKVLDEIMHSGKYMSLIWLDILVVVIVFAVPYASNGLVSRIRGATGEPRRYARVVVPTAVLILPLGLSVVLGAAMLLCDCPWNPNSCQMAQCIVMLQATRFILEYAGWILAVGGLALQFTDGGFKVASDIASYFKTDVAHTNANPLTALALAYRYNPRKETSFGASWVAACWPSAEMSSPRAAGCASSMSWRTAWERSPRSTRLGRGRPPWPGSRSTW